jgi:uncharacterized protein (TIRG00374 family)
MERTRQRKKALGSIFKIGFSLSLLALVLWHVGWGEAWESLRAAQLPYLGVALLLHVVAIPVRAYRWRILLTALGISVPLSRLTALYFVGSFFNTFLPTGIGGDIVRIYELGRQSGQPAAVGTVLVDRATGILMLFLMALAALPFGYRLISPQTTWLIACLFLTGWGGLWLILRRDWLEKWGLLRILSKVKQIEEVYEAVHACGVKAISGALAASFALNLLLIATNYFVGLSLGVRISIWYYLLFVPIISSLLVLPISLSGVGVREGGYIYFFAQAGVAPPQALTMSLLVYAMNLTTGCVGAVLYIVEGARGLRGPRGKSPQ